MRSTRIRTVAGLWAWRSPGPIPVAASSSSPIHHNRTSMAAIRCSGSFARGTARWTASFREIESFVLPSVRSIAALARAGVAMLVVTTVSCRPPRIKPLQGAPAPVQQLPKGDLPEGHRKIVFKWELRDGDMSARGDGVARVASPDSVRLDLFLGGGFGGGAAVLIGDSLRAPGPEMARKLI